MAVSISGASLCAAGEVDRCRICTPRTNARGAFDTGQSNAHTRPRGTRRIRNMPSNAPHVTKQNAPRRVPCAWPNVRPNWWPGTDRRKRPRKQNNVPGEKRIGTNCARGEKRIGNDCANKNAPGITPTWTTTEKRPGAPATTIARAMLRRCGNDGKNFMRRTSITNASSAGIQNDVATAAGAWCAIRDRADRLPGRPRLWSRVSRST